MLKREVDKLDGEVASKNQVISEYKTICSQLSAKLEKAQANAKENDKDGDSKENEKTQVSFHYTQLPRSQSGTIPKSRKISQDF